MPSLPVAIRRAPLPRRRVRGFTLIELVVVLIIVGVLAAAAMPRYLALGRDARLASLRAMNGALWTATSTVHTACGLIVGCDYGLIVQSVTIGGRPAEIDYGWLNAGDSLGAGQIDSWVDVSGFTAVLTDALHTTFTLDGAPDPANCSVTYEEASFNPAKVPTITSKTSGC